MSINKAMRIALKALSYPDVDIKKSYKLERSVQNIKSPVLSAIYKKWERTFSCNGREIPTRFYMPKNTDEPLGLLLFFHGGGWVKSSIDTYNSVCRTLSRQTGFAVASVEYSLAPEFPFPCGLEDCYTVAKEVITNALSYGFDAEKIVLIGDSAGGNLAAAVSMMARDKGEFKVNNQILIYPATWNDHSNNSRFDSVRENGTDYLLTSKRICDYMHLYISNPENLNSPYFAPLLAESFDNLPRTLVITAEFDPLRDEGEELARQLNLVGKNAECFRIHNALHGFFSLPYRFVHVKKTYVYINNFLSEVS